MAVGVKVPGHNLSLLLVIAALLIPASAYALDEPYVEISVEKGDCLIRISEKNLEDSLKWREVARINRIKDPDLIFPGQVIRIPERLLKGTPVGGTVSFVKGEAKMRTKAGADWRPLRIYDRVDEGSEIRTSGGGAVELTLDSGDSFFQKADTFLLLSIARRKGELYVHRLFLETGRALTRIMKATGRASRIEIDTPSAICAARGTEFRTSVDGADTTRSEVLQGTVDVGAMKETVTVQQGEGTLVRKGEPPVEPVRLLSTPKQLDPQAIYKRMPLRFEFERLTGAESYRVLLARDSGCRDIVKEAVISPAGNFEISGLEDGTYFLQVASIDGLGLEGLPSKVTELRIRTHPVAPFINLPINGTVYREGSLRAQWLMVEDAAAYHVQIADEQEFLHLLEDSSGIKSNEHRTKQLDSGKYYFRIASIAEDGFEGDWSDALAFSIIPPPPAPSIEEPVMDKKGIHIRWKDLGKGFRYHFQMSRDRDFTELLADKRVDESSVQVPKPSAGSYYVRTSAIDREDYEGSFSQPQRFEVQRYPYEVWGIAALWLILLLL